MNYISTLTEDTKTKTYNPKYRAKMSSQRVMDKIFNTPAIRGLERGLREWMRQSRVLDKARPRLIGICSMIKDT